MVHADDAMLFEEVQSALASADASAASAQDERRSAERNSYVTLHYMAPYDGANLPHQTDLKLVPLIDISPNGFSFVCREKPRFRQLIVMLGKVPMQAFTANVKNVVSLAGGEGLFKVGCQFEDRL